MQPLKFIDIHAHVCKQVGPQRGGKQAFATADQLIAIYDRVGVERAVILPLVNAECLYQVISNEEALAVAREYPRRFVPFCNIDPRQMRNAADAPLGDLLRYYKDQGCKGIGEVCANMPFLDPMVQNLFKHAQDAGLPLTFHIAPRIGGYYGLYDEPGLPQLELCLQRFPKLKFLAHSQPFWAEMAPLETPADRCKYPNYPVKEEGVVPKLMRRYPNLLGDLSAGSGCNALARDPNYAVRFLEEFQDKLFFGLDLTDFNGPVTNAPLADFLLRLGREQKIAATVLRKVARDNARQLLGLD